MLFAPEKWKMVHPWETMRDGLAEMKSRLRDDGFSVHVVTKTEEQKQRDEENDRREAHRKKYFPDDDLQLRYRTENEAKDSHETLKLQCLIPPRWRHFLLWTIGRQQAWRRYGDEDEED